MKPVANNMFRIGTSQMEPHNDDYHEIQERRARLFGVSRHDFILGRNIDERNIR